MIELRAPQRWTEVELRLEPDDTRGPTAAPAAPVLVGALGVGQPLARRVVEGDLADASAVAFWRAASAENDFHLVELACTFRPPQRTPFRNAWLKVRLDAPGAHPPIAWSMAPLRTTRSWTRSRSLDFKGQLQLLEVGASVGREEEVHAPVVEALNLRQPDPMWELTSSSAEPLSGVRLFALIVSSPAGVAARGEVSLTATVERWRFVRYAAAFPGGAGATFVLSKEPSHA